VGKSSVLLAGVVPRLRAAAAAPRAGRRPLAVAVMREWRDPPLPRLAEAIRDSVIDACGDADIPSWAPGEPLAETLRAYSERVRTTLVILDQFEEYFLYHRDEYGPGTLDDELPALMSDAGLRVHFMISLREDALARLDRFSGRIPDLFANYVRIGELDREGAREAVLRPIEAYNSMAGEDSPVSIERELVDAVLDQVRTGAMLPGAGHDSAAGDRIETPFLQLVMDRLWREAADDGSGRLSLAGLERLGGASAIVSHHLGDALDSLSPADRRVAADLFQFLVTPSRSKITQSAADLAYWTARPETDVRRVLDQLAAGDRRILRSVPPPPDAPSVDRYEIFHDVIAEPVLEWSDRERESAERERLEREIARPERARIGDYRIVIAILLALNLALTLLVVLLLA
jgi:hypothetical protein